MDLEKTGAEAGDKAPMRVNRKLLPVKAHYFFFMACLGPILPQLQVFGKQLGISSVVMGTVTGVLPFMFLLAKPAFGYVADKYRSYRKLIFITLVASMGVFYSGLYFVQAEPKQPVRFNLTGTPSSRVCVDDLYRCNATDMKSACHVALLQCTTNDSQLSFQALPTAASYSYSICVLPFADGNNTMNCTDSSISCEEIPNEACSLGVSSFRFWYFVLLMGAGTIAFNVVNSISDAICFDMLGDGEQTLYGRQRVWGTIGFGLSALLSGYVVDCFANSFTPAVLIMIGFLVVDVIWCSRLRFPKIEAPTNILKEVFSLLRHRRVCIFIVFAALVGILDSFFVYFFFWYLEDLAAFTGHTHHIKLLEGVVVAAETLGGEVLFFSVSGAILNAIGYGHALSVCFVMYALRLVLISVLPSPWWAVPVELCLQGPTYALSYTTIVAYASALAPEGASATMQGLVAGIDDGFGYAIGSLVGGLLFRAIGGHSTVLVFCALALICAVVHHILYRTVIRFENVPDEEPEEEPEDAVSCHLNADSQRDDDDDD